MASPNNTSAQRRALHFVYAYGEWEVVFNASDPDTLIERDQLEDGAVYVLMFGGEPVATCSTHGVRVVSTWSDGSGDHDVDLRVLRSSSKKH